MDALILVDLQYDFLPGGALAVDQGHEVLPIACELAQRAPLVVATQDWHPPDHGSFASNHAGRHPGETINLDGLLQVLWPDHCVQGSRGADLHENLRLTRIDAVFRKGQDPTVDSYSGFYDNGRRRATGLADWLRARAVKRVVLTGLATDYCVAATAVDAASEGFEVVVLLDAIRAVELAAGDSERAITRMMAAGVQPMHSRDLTFRHH